MENMLQNAREGFADTLVFISTALLLIEPLLMMSRCSAPSTDLQFEICKVLCEM